MLYPETTKELSEVPWKVIESAPRVIESLGRSIESPQMPIDTRRELILKDSARRPLANFGRLLG